MSVAIDPCDRAIAIATAPSASSPRQGRWILLTTILASSLATIDGSVVNVGLAAIGASLHESGAGLTWVLNSYLLPLSGLLLIGGAAGDLYGRGRLLLIGTVAFAAASLLCALAPTLGWLLAGRALQGIGASLLLPNSLAILGAAFSGEARGRAIGIWAAVGAGAGALGPLVGGWLIDTVGWRAIFLVNLPIAALVVALAWRHVPNERSATREPLDAAGGALATVALGASTWALTAWSAMRRVEAGMTLSLLLGAIATIAFIVVERGRGARAMLPFALFASPMFVGLTLLTLLLYGALGGLLVLVPYALIQTQGYSATAAGAALLPLPVVIALGSSTAGRLAARAGPRLLLILGPVIAAAGCALCLHITGDGSYWTTVLPALLVLSLGMACAVAPLTTAVLASVDTRHGGVASGFNSAVARTGGLVATALLGGVLSVSGGAVEAPFRTAVLIAAAAALLAGICAFIWIRGDQGVARR